MHEALSKLTLFVCIIPQALAQPPAEKWVFRNIQDGGREIVFLSSTKAFEQRIPVALRFRTAQQSPSCIQFEFIIGGDLRVL